MNILYNLTADIWAQQTIEHKTAERNGQLNTASNWL
mgnify:CR=1 FL=1